MLDGDSVETPLGKCLKPLAVAVETNVRYRSSRPVISLFFAASVLRTMEVRIQEGLRERVLADPNLTANECMKPSVIIVEISVLFRFSLMLENQSIAASVLRTKKIREAGMLNNIRNSLKP